MENIIMHIDVNNAFLSWSAIDLLNKGYKYDIRNSYAVIGGDESKRSGIVLAKSLPAKKQGIFTSETLYSAKKKCPALRVYPPNFEFYKEMSNKLFKLISSYTPDIEIASIDECYMDYGKVKKLYGDEVEFANNLKARIKNELGFTVNIGIANSKLCAKMASDFSKPYKVHTLYNFEIEEKMWPLDIGDLFGIGKKTVPKLQSLGINKIYDLAHYDKLKLYKYFKNQASHMVDIACGIDESRVDSSYNVPKGIGNEFTLNHDVNDIIKLNKCLLTLSASVGKRLRKENMYASTICVIIKDNFFKRKSHQKKLKNVINTDNEIYINAKEVLKDFYSGESVRLIGIRLDNLVSKNTYQTSLFDDINIHDNDEKIDYVVDSLKRKYGDNIVNKASLKYKS